MGLMMNGMAEISVVSVEQDQEGSDDNSQPKRYISIYNTKSSGKN